MCHFIEENSLEGKGRCASMADATMFF